LEFAEPIHIGDEVGGAVICGSLGAGA